MVKIIGEAKSIFIIEESSNNIDWSIVFLRKYQDVAETIFEQYRQESSSPYIRMVKFDRAHVIASYAGESTPVEKKHTHSYR